MTAPDEYEAPEREHVDCGWCDSGSCRDGSKCGLNPHDTYTGDEYDHRRTHNKPSLGTADKGSSCPLI